MIFGPTRAAGPACGTAGASGEATMRDVAYWPKAFLDEIENGAPASGARLWALGGPGFVYRTPLTTIWIDPYFSGTPDSMAADGAFRATAIPINPAEATLGDVIISTHAHIYHCH